MDVYCMTLDEIDGLVGKEVYTVWGFDVRKHTVHWVLWYEDDIVLGFVRNDPYSRDSARIENTCLTKESLLKELPNFICNQKKEFEEEYEETIREAKETLISNLKWLEKSEQSFLKQLENM